MVLTTRRQARLQDLSQDVGETSTVETHTESLRARASLSQKKRTASSSAASSSASSSASSGEESSGDEDDEDDDDSESDSQTSSNIDDNDEEVDIDKLFEESLKACQDRDRAAAASTSNLSAFETSADQISLGAGGSTVKGKEKEVLADALKNGTKRRSDESYEAFFGRLKRGDDLGDQKPKTESQMYRERQKVREKTAGSKWFDMPAFPKSTSSSGRKGSKKGQQHQSSASGPTAEGMTRQVQAIRLRNAMDPKRFYRGGNGVTEKGMPAFAQMGRIISSNLEPASTMSRSERGRTVIDELVKDAQNAAYTKRKFNEQQARTDVGRSSHISKRNSRNSGKKQKQRR